MKAFALALAAFAIGAASLTEAVPPHLEGEGAAARLIVQGKPFLILGGELGNSSDSSAAYMAPHWPRLAGMHLNTVFAPVSWELVEPVEGRFDWRSVDEIIGAARANGLKLVLLWFGAWKNSESTYVPAWVKRTERRFPRARMPDGRALDVLSAFAPGTREADARAFTALLAHLAATDNVENTVLMIQVENEVGMLPVARDFSAAAQRAFRAPVPAQLVRMLDSGAFGSESSPSEARRLWMEHGSKRIGDWAALLGSGDEADEVFTAWYYARYINALATAGKAAYPLPMYVNAALNRPGRRPGEYPSGGPLPQLLDVWKTAAPALDFLAPDIYFPNFVALAARYARGDNPLFIPEAGRADGAEVAANIFYALGDLGALGLGPFSIESIDDRQPNALAQAYEVLRQLSPMILACEGKGCVAGFRPQVLEDGTLIDTPVMRRIGGYEFTVAFVDPWTPRAEQNPTDHGGIILETAPDDYLVSGQGIIVTFAPAGDGGSGVEGGAPPQAGIDFAEEGSFDEHGGWSAGRRLNGDQTNQGRYLRLAPGRFQIQRVRLYQYR